LIEPKECHVPKVLHRSSHPSAWWRRELARLAVGLLLAAVAVLGGAHVATAHDVLLGSEPADGAVLDTAPAEVVLTFSAEQVDVGTAVTVTGPDGEPWADGAPVVAGATVTQGLRDGMPSGDYAVAWRSVSGDGHPIEGTFGFTVDAGPAPTAEPEEPPVDATPEPEPDGATEPPVEPTATPAATSDVDDEGPASTGPPAVPGAPGADTPVLWLVGGLAAATLAALTVAALRRRTPPG
jgi:copper resistance protein C